jgi:hypothetical protein
MYGSQGGLEVVDETRCPVCGRPSKGGTLLTNEKPCGGCHNEYDAAILEGKSAAEAQAIAKAGHEKRELAAYDLLIKTRRERVASGKSATDGVTPLQDFTDPYGNVITVAMMKARAQAALDGDAGVK